MRIRELLFEVLDVDQTYQRYGQKIAQRLELKDNDPELESKVKEVINKLNLNNNFGYFLWTLTNWLNKNIQRLEDVERAQSYLEIFNKNKGKFTQRDINKYVPFVSSQTKKPEQLVLQTEIEKFVKDNPPDEEQLARDIEQANKEINLIHKDSQMTIIRLLTELAANVWGRDTDWCTAYGYKFGKHPSLTNQFDYYNGQGPLYVFIFSNDTKYQLHNASDQLMDINDQPVEEIDSKLFSAIEKIKLDKKYSNQFDKFLSWGFRIIPPELKTPEMCMAAVKQDGYALVWVPNELRTPDLCLVAIKQDGDALRYVPNKLKTPDLCLAAVTQDGAAIQYVPNELRTPDLCMAAVTQDGIAIRYVPNELRTPDLCMAAVKKNANTLQYVPHDLQDEIKQRLSNEN
jgi:hypothetical protein